jgi:hypothetical protein
MQRNHKNRLLHNAVESSANYNEPKPGKPTDGVIHRDQMSTANNKQGIWERTLKRLHPLLKEKN